MTESKITTEPYWLCCGSLDSYKHDKNCIEAKVGLPKRCRFGSSEDHSKWSRRSKHLTSSIKVLVKDTEGVDLSKIKDIMCVVNGKAAELIYILLKDEGFSLGDMSDNITVGTTGIREDQP